MKQQKHMNAMLLLLALTFLVVAGNALQQIRPDLPPPFQDEDSARSALDTYIWERRFPAESRRKYLLSVAFSAMAFICIAIGAYNADHHLFASVSGLLVIVAVGYGLLRWWQYRDRL